MVRILVLLVLVAFLPAPAVTQQPPSGMLERLKRSVRSYSVPVSPTVMASIASREDRLEALVLWRGGFRWYQPMPHRQYGGGDAKGTINIGLQYGAADVWFSRVPQTTTVTVQALIDGVDTSEGATLIKAFFLDPLDSDLDFRAGTLAPLLRVSPEVVAFLQCDRYTPKQMNRLDACPEIMRLREAR